jgi:uncharacterized protein YggT (Ycf19 family)
MLPEGENAVQYTNETGRSFVEFAFFTALVILALYLILSWSFGTADVNQWAGLMQASTSPLVQLFWGILHNLGLLNSLA